MDFPKSVPNVGLVDGQFVDESTGTGQPGSLIPAAWGNSVTLEILEVLKSADVVPDEFKTDQLVTAISKIVSSKGFLKKGDYGFGSSVVAEAAIDTIGLPSGFYSFNSGGSSFANYVSVLNLPYSDAAYSAQIGFQQGAPEPSMLIRSCKAPNAWTVTREVWHSGNFNPSAKVDKASSLSGYNISDAYTKSQIDFSLGLLAPLSDPVFTGRPSGPTAVFGTANSQLATTKFAADLAAKKMDIGQYGVGATSVSAVSVDTIGLPGGLYSFSSGETSFANYVSFINIPYANSKYSAQIGIVQGSVEPTVCVRGCSADGVWGNTRTLWHDGNLGSSSEVRPGIVKVSTQAITDAGVDDTTVVTPKKIRFGFKILKEDNGYIFLPSWLGGFAIQWGAFSIASGGGASQNISFPTPFPSKTFTAWAAVNGAASEQIGTSNRTASGLVVQKGAGDTSSRQGYWIAIGC